MNSPVRILHLEDDLNDFELVRATLQSQGASAEIQRVDTRDDFIRALEVGGIDVILADYNLPSFNGLAALELAREHSPEVPFLFVSGLIGEERALESLKTGATDYVFKHHLARLAPAVSRALLEASERAERRRAEAALKASEGTLRSFFDTAPFMMGIVELAGDGLRYPSTNLAAAQHLGTTPEAPCAPMAGNGGMSQAVAEAWVRNCQKAQGSQRPACFEYQEERAGKTSSVSVTVSQLPSIPGHPSRFCFVAEDITEKRQLEHQSLRAQRMESIGTLAGGIAHDLNNVLAPMLMSLKLFRSKLTEPDDQSLLQSLESSARRGADIVRQVLAFARGLDGERAPLPFAKIIGDLERFIRDTFPRSIRIETRVTEAPWKATGDATQIYQVLMNLCVNARDAMPNGGQLRIDVENLLAREPFPHLLGEVKPGAYVVIGVTDTGAGIPAEIRDKIFEPFFTTKEIGQGTGLGLSTVLSIAKGHKGFLHLDSQVGHGTEIRVYLPAESAVHRVESERNSGPSPTGNGQVILVVDDEAAIRLVAKRTLEGHGYKVLLAADGAEALALGKQRHAIDVIVTDMMMPSMGGATLVRSLRAFRPSVPVVGMSGLMDTRKASEISGFDEVFFLQKPFAAETLLEAVERALKTGKHQGQLQF